MPSPAEHGPPPRRLLGRGPGAAVPAEEDSLPDLLPDPLPAPSGEAAGLRAEGESLAGPRPVPVAGPLPVPPAGEAAGSRAEGQSPAGPRPVPVAGSLPVPPDGETPGARAEGESLGDPEPEPLAGLRPLPPAGEVPGLPDGPAARRGEGSPAAAGSPVPERVEGARDAAVAEVGGHGGPEAGSGGLGGAGGSAGARGSAGRPETGAEGVGGGDGRFTLKLANFEGPFDLLLQLISRHKLDVTEVALSKVTDEFMAHIRAMGPDWDLDQTTEFLVVAATLLDLKAARLLPVAEVEDEGDLALLEARDLLFARLLQYRAYKQIAEIFQVRAEAEGKRYPRTVGLEAHLAELLPEVVISIGADGLARLAVKAMQPRAAPQVYVDHIHAPLVSVREQAALVVTMLKARGEATFQELTEDTADTLTVVARFLALLELYREKAVVLDQEEALKTLTVRWSGGDGDGMPRVTDEFDQIVEAKE